MTIPEQVRRQSEAVAQMYADRDTNVEGTNAAAQTGAEAVSSDQADSVGNSASESAATEQRPAGTKALDTAEQRYRTLQGMYNADTAKLRGELQLANNRLTQLEQLLATLSSQSPQPADEPVAPLITAKDIEEYGDSIDVMRRVSKEEAAKAERRLAEMEHRINSLQTTVLPRVEQVVHRQAMSAEQAFWAELSAAVPDFRQINDNREFQSWLLEVDPLTGLTRQTYLEDAQRNNDSRRVASIFATWRNLTGHTVAHPNRAAPVSELDKLVSPGRGRSSGSAPTGNSPKAYSPQEIAKFFDDVRKGVYRGREAERDQIERDIFAAARDKRVVATG